MNNAITKANELVNFIPKAVSKKGHDTFTLELSGNDLNIGDLPNYFEAKTLAVKTASDLENVLMEMVNVIDALDAEKLLLPSKVSALTQIASEAANELNLTKDAEKKKMKQAKKGSGLQAALVNAKQVKASKAVKPQASPAVSTAPAKPKTAVIKVAAPATALVVSSPADIFREIVAEYVETFSNASATSHAPSVQHAFANMDLSLKIKKNGLVDRDSLKFKQLDKWVETIKGFNKANGKKTTQAQKDLQTEICNLLAIIATGGSLTRAVNPATSVVNQKKVKKAEKSSKRSSTKSESTNTQQEEKGGVVNTAKKVGKDVISAGKILVVDLPLTILGLDEKSKKEAADKKEAEANRPKTIEDKLAAGRAKIAKQHAKTMPKAA